MSTTEQVLRREAIRRRLSGERRGAICQDLGRSPRWFDKWWAAFRHDPHADFGDHSRAPRTVTSVISPQLEQLVISLRHLFEAAPHGLIGARTIRHQLHAWQVTPLPSEATIQRILARHSLTHPWGAATATAYYPWLAPTERNVVPATDIITRHL